MSVAIKYPRPTGIHSLVANDSFGAYIEQRKQKFDQKNAGIPKFPEFLGYQPKYGLAINNKKVYENPTKIPSIFQGDPMTLQRSFMVSPCPEMNASAQRRVVTGGTYSYGGDQRCVPVNPLSKFGINVHDRLGPLKLADFKQNVQVQPTSRGIYN
jgi:hypothetical protein